MFLLSVGLLTLYVYGLLDGPGYILILPCYYFEVLQCCFMPSNVQKWVMVLLDVPYISLQRFLQIPQYIPHHIQSCHT